jgi:hypothetical protein
VSADPQAGRAARHEQVRQLPRFASHQPGAALAEPVQLGGDRRCRAGHPVSRSIQRAMPMTLRAIDQVHGGAATAGRSAPMPDLGMTSELMTVLSQPIRATRRPRRAVARIAGDAIGSFVSPHVSHSATASARSGRASRSPSRCRDTSWLNLLRPEGRWLRNLRLAHSACDRTLPREARSWLEPSPFGSRNGSQSQFDMLELIL